MAGTKQKRQLFPEKLWDLVNEPSSGIKWSSDGKKIEVERCQLEKFLQTELCDRNFHGSSSKFRSHNFDSFIRQLHFYGFKKCGNSYHHDRFQRGRPEALQTMKRKYSNLTIHQTQNSPESQIPKARMETVPNIKTFTATTTPTQTPQSTNTIPIRTAITATASSHNNNSQVAALGAGKRKEVTMYTMKAGTTEESSFTNVREDRVKATGDDKTLSITLPNNIDDETERSFWPKTLVLDSYCDGNQRILSAYFVYRFN